MEYLTTNYLLKLTSEITTTSNNSILIIKNNGSNDIVYQKEVSIDLTENSYKKFTRNNLLSLANYTLDNTLLSQQEITEFSDLTFQFAIDYRSSLEVELFYQEISYSISYQLAILKMVNRASQNSLNSCNCSTYGKYLFDEAPFICNEDLIYTIDFVKDYFESLYSLYDSSALDTAGIDSILTFAGNNPGTNINQGEVESMVLNNADDPFIIDPTSGANDKVHCDNSASLGCCGNNGPSEPCKRCNIFCLLHDLACWNCGQSTQLGHLGCGRSCVPEG